LDRVIGWAAAAGAYTLLDLQWINTEVKIAPLPDFETPRLWRMLGERYRDNPAVLFDLYNEPHDVKPVDWRYWATLLTDTLREVHPEALVFVSGTDWGYDLRGVRIDREHVVYSPHVYPNKTKRLDRGKAFGHLAGEVPLFAGEWGGWDGDLAWGLEQARYFNDLEMGWTAWSWCDEPHLMRNGEPTLFGRLVKGALLPVTS
jgi:aryl-phospho-beta-D-glucosidase BglC (GH1 family)